MASVTHNAIRRQPAQSASRPHLGPPIALGVAIIVAAAAVALSPAPMTEAGASAAVVTSLFVMAGAIALLAWMLGRGSQPRGLTYWDVAGVLTFIGICVGSTIEPQQLVELVGPYDRRP